MSVNNLIIVLVVIAFIVIWKSIIRVPEHQVAVIFRLGRKLQKPKGPGFVFVIPIMDRVRVVDTDELEHELPDISSVTRDSMPVLVTLRYRSQVFDPDKFIPAIGNWEEKAIQTIIDIIFKLMGEIDSSELHEKTKYLNQMFRINLDGIMRPYGVLVTNVAITNLKLDDRLGQIYDAKISIGNIGEAESQIHRDTGKVLLDGKSWDAVSNEPIAPNKKVRIKRVILEVEENDTSNDP